MLTIERATLKERNERSKAGRNKKAFREYVEGITKKKKNAFLKKKNKG